MMGQARQLPLQMLESPHTRLTAFRLSPADLLRAARQLGSRRNSPPQDRQRDKPTYCRLTRMAESSASFSRREW